MNEGVHYEIKAAPHPTKAGVFLAYISGARIGTRVVRQHDGSPRLFRTREEAEAAAARALCDVMNAPMRPAVKVSGAKVFGVKGSGRSRFMSEAEALFRPRSALAVSGSAPRS